MRTVNIHEAKTNLSRLVEQAAAGDPFIIAKAGKPLVRVVPIDAPESAARRRRGFLAGRITVQPGYDAVGAAEIEKLFG